ncbi:hypothetical protein K0M31_001904 [Melipona bicolor]|uniref:Uncharacterized protein n=1 Tax=Melipona bicolor TaxID=60889 RepID=A0AA40GGK0_9HYME|nr:hypothetical protein K0M31_001904 [Melipona bicolor]
MLNSNLTFTNCTYACDGDYVVLAETKKCIAHPPCPPESNAKRRPRKSVRFDNRGILCCARGGIATSGSKTDLIVRLTNAESGIGSQIPELIEELSRSEEGMHETTDEIPKSCWKEN